MLNLVYIKLTDMKPNKIYNIITIGCQMNYADSERLATFLEKNGFTAGNDFKKAGLVVLNTCGIRQAAEDRVYGLVNQIKKQNPRVKIVVTGCLSRRADVKKRLAGRADIFLPINEMLKLPELLAGEKFSPHFSLDEVRLEAGEKYLHIPPKHTSVFTAYVPIGNGCNNFCSYCVVPYARGREVYRPARDIIAEVRALVKDGYREIILIAQNVNSYRDVKYDFPGLLQELLKISGKFWLRFSSSHPKDMSDELIKVIGSSEKICAHLHLAVQSGDDKILQAMNRKYTAASYKRLVKKVRAARPGIAITTDVIVGFPGETKAQFLNTVKLFKDINFDLAYISQYSQRPQTVSATMKDNVSLAEKKQRANALNEILKQTALKNHQKFLGKTVEVLIEGKNKRGKYYGKTSGYQTVLVNSVAADLIGQFIPVLINKALPFGLEGDYLDKPKVLVILGTTASGKTSLGVKLAAEFNGEIISADSRQVYKGMDIGTGKDLVEYQINGRKIPYHLIDVVSPKVKFDLAQYQVKALQAISQILKKKKLPIIVGGSGLYLQALVDNYQLSTVIPDFAQRIKLEKLSAVELFKKLQKLKPDFAARLNNSDKNNPRRLTRYLEIVAAGGFDNNKKTESPYDFLLLGLTWPDKILRGRIELRLLERLEKEGMIAEIKKLNESGVSWERLKSFGLEYKFISRHLLGELSYAAMVEKLSTAIYRFAKRQKTWFRRWQKQGTKIKWLKDPAEAIREIKYWQK